MAAFKKGLILLLVLLSVAGLCAAEEWIPMDYADPANWFYTETERADTRADVFFVPTTAYSGSDGGYVIDLTDESRMAKYLGTVNMEKGIWDQQCRFFAPVYRQASLLAFSEFGPDSVYFDHAYQDVRAAFLYYLENYNNGRPIVLAGFSQGGIMCQQLVKEFFADADLSARLVACYTPGWRITADDLAAYPHLRPAQGEADTGVIIAYTTEAEGVTESLLVPRGMRTYAINPLNWKTDSTPADRSMNPGACFTDYSGAITDEIPELTGAYIDPVRGTLIATDVTPAQYPGVQFEDGIYHVYDYMFFYRSLQHNVAVRIDAWHNNAGNKDSAY